MKTERREPGESAREFLARSPVSKAFGIVTDEPHLRAAFRQGIDEIGEALKAFPDSIQKTEIGGLFTPTPAEVAREHGVFGQTIEQSEGMTMNTQDPVSQALDAARGMDARGPAEPDRQASPERNPVANVVEVSRAETLRPQQTPMGQAQDQDLSRGR
jgi:hypothetical protein